MYPTLMCRGVLRGGTSWKLWKKLDTLETGRNNETEDTEKKFLNSSSMLHPLKVVQKIIVIESDLSKTKSCNSLILEMYLTVPKNADWSYLRQKLTVSSH